MQLGALADAIGARLIGSPELQITRVQTLQAAGPSDLAACFEARYRADLQGTRAGAVLIDQKYEALVPDGCVRLVADDPRSAWNKTLRLLSPGPLLRPPAVGIHPSAVVDPITTGPLPLSSDS